MLLARLPAILWLIVACIGMGFQLTALVAARVDRQTLIDRGYNSTMRLLSDSRVRSNLVRAWAIGIDIVLGIVGVTLPTAAETPRPLAAVLTGLLLAVGLLAVEMLLIANTILDSRDRRRIEQYPDTHALTANVVTVNAAKEAAAVVSEAAVTAAVVVADAAATAAAKVAADTAVEENTGARNPTGATIEP